MSNTTKPALRALIFDMDGLLVDSEPLWHEAELDVFPHVGVPITLADCVATTGIRIDEIARHYHRLYPWEGPSPEDVAERIVDGVVAAVLDHGQPMEGAVEAVHAATTLGLPLAVATSSPLRLAWPILERLGLRDVFEHVLSAEALPLGKPHPEVYLRAAEALGTPAANCMAFEDSINGMVAAKAAGMRCVAVPTRELTNDPRFALADVRLSSLREATPAWFQSLAG